MSQIASASASPFTFSFTDPATGATNAADTSPADFARLSLSAQMAAITADGINVQAGTSGQLLVGTPADQALFTMANGTVTELAVPDGFEVAPADIDAATFEGFPDAVKSAYLSYNGLPANATIGTATAPFPAYLASAKALPFAFTFGGIDTSLADFEALDAPTRATLVTGYGTDGALLVGTPDDGLATFTLAADGSVEETREPAAFALLPEAMDPATYGTFAPDERALYLRLNGLGAGSMLGAPAFPAYPAASLATPATFLDASDQPSTALPSFDVLTPALQALAVRQAGGTLLVGTAGNQALFALDGTGHLTRTAVPPGFALTPAAMDFSTYASFGSAIQALYLAFNGMAATDTLGTAASSFVPSTSGMTSGAWGAMTASQQSDYLFQHGLSRALLSTPSTATPAPSGAMTAAQWLALTPAEQTFFAQVYGLSDAITTAPAAMTAAAWTNILALGPGPAGLSSQGALYLVLNGLDPSLTSAYGSSAVQAAYPGFSAASRQFLARAYDLPDAYALLPSAMTAYAWTQLDPGQKGAYLRTTGLDKDAAGDNSNVDRPPSTFGRSVAGLSADELDFFLRVNGLSAAFATVPSGMTSAVWFGMTSEQQRLYVKMNSLPDILAAPPSALTAATYASLNTSEQAFVVAVNDLPAAFTTATADMTAATWAQLTAAQQVLYLQVNGLSAATGTPLASMTSGAYATLDAGEKSFFLRINGLSAALQVAPSSVTHDLWTAWGKHPADTPKETYLRLNGLSPNAGATPTTLDRSTAAPLSAGEMAFFATVNGMPAGFTRPPNAMLASTVTPAVMDATTFGRLTIQEKAAYLTLNGLPLDTTIGVPPFKAAPYGTTIGLGRMTAATFASLTSDRQISYIASNKPTASQAAKFGVTLGTDPVTGAQTFTVGPPGTAPLMVQAGVTVPVNPYGSAVSGGDILGSTVNQTTALAIEPMQDGTDRLSLAMVAALSATDAAAYAQGPSALSAQTFENWPSQVQLAYLAKNTPSSGVYTIGPAGAQIHVFLRTGSTTSVAPKLYIAETLTKTDIAGMAYADQVKLNTVAGVDGVLGNLGMTNKVDAVASLLNTTYQYFIFQDGTTIPNTSPPGTNVMNHDDINVFISQLNLISAQLFGLGVPTPSPTPGSGAAPEPKPKVAVLGQTTLSGTQTGGSAIFSLNDIQTQLTALQSRFKRLAAFELQANNVRAQNDATTALQSDKDNFYDQYDTSPLKYGQDQTVTINNVTKTVRLVDYQTYKQDLAVSGGGNTSEADHDVGASASCNVLAQQEAVIASAAYAAANLSATAKNGSSKNLDLPALICLFEMYAYAGQQAIVKGDTEEVNAVNALLQYYAQAQQVVNACSSWAKPNTPTGDYCVANFSALAGPSTDARYCNLPDHAELTTMFAPNRPSSAIETLYGITRPSIDTTGDQHNEYWTGMGTTLSSVVTQINQQSQAKMNDITSENKQADRYSDLANTALSKLSDTLQKIAGTS